MQKEIDIRIHPEQIHNKELIGKRIARQCKVSVIRIKSYKLIRRSIDARKT